MSRSTRAVKWVVVSWVLSIAPAALAGDPPKDAAAEAASGPASGQATGTAKTDDAAAAQELFDQGMALMAERKFAEACAKLEASNKAAWAPGTTINLADCYEQTGRLASAWAKFLEAEPHFRNRTPPDPRADIAKQRADALYPKLSRLTIEVPAESKATGLQVERDGSRVDESQWGTGLPVDPGKHVVQVTATGKKTWTWEGEVAAGAAPVTVKVPVLADEPVADRTPVPADTVFPTQKKIAIGVGAAGVVGLAIGGIFGGLTLGKVGDANKTCSKGADGSFVCDAAGAQLRDEASGMAMGSTVALIAGGVLAAGGVVLWLTAPSGGSPKDGGAPAAKVWIAPVVGSTSGLAAGGVF